MDAPVSADVFLFEAFRFDRRAGALFRRDEGGALDPVTMGTRAVAVLDILVARHGDLVSKEEIMDAVWPGTVVEDNNLTVQISALRRVLDHGRAEGSCIQTIAGRGYRFVGTVTREGRGARPRLSIVVLPFANLGEDREQQYFADGITDDVTTDLSRLADMFVISRNTAFTYRNKPADTKQIGRELGVRYVLEGSVRRSGSRVRINAQLVDAETDAHLWAERFDSDTVDLFTLQDEITSRISVALGSELFIAAAAQPTEHPDALDYIFRARAPLSKPPTRDNYAEAIGLFERALALDPGSVEAQSSLAIVLVRRVLDNMNDSAASAAADIARAEELVAQALAVSPSSPRAHFAKGDLLCARSQFAEAIPEYETVLASNRNSVDALAIIGRCKIYIGMIDEAVPLAEQALRLSPRDRWTGVWCSWIGQAHLLQSRTDEAILWLEKARSANPAIPYIHLYLAAAYALRGESERAAAELAEARRLVGDDRWSSMARVRAVGGYWGVPKVRTLYETTVFAGLRKAGMPEE
jgi:adenylate cyclase